MTDSERGSEEEISESRKEMSIRIIFGLQLVMFFIMLAMYLLLMGTEISSECSPCCLDWGH